MAFDPQQAFGRGHGAAHQLLHVLGAGQEAAAAKTLMNAIEQVTAAPLLCTGDLGGQATTGQVTQSVCDRITGVARRKAA